MESGLIFIPPWALMLLSPEARQASLPLVILGVCDLAAVALWSFQTYRLLKTGQTLGKKWFGLKVVRVAPGPMGLRNHFVRGVMVNLFSWMGAPFLFLRADRRGLHDLVADTLVIEV
jgi:uncharacterized RDD family membrane protein YckC